jgi:predicted SprT family Zn-dependent metalloprotease
MHFIPLDSDDPLVWVHDRADELLKEFGLWNLGWRFELADDVRTVGWCHHSIKRICYSKYFLHHGRAQIEDTLRHEIAHALVGPNEGHNANWRRMAVMCGARPRRCAPQGVTPDKPHNFLMECPDCGQRWRRYRMRRRNYGSKCPECGVAVIILDLRDGSILYMP